jgi:hypothetical protein
MRLRLLAACLACALAGPAVSFAQQSPKPAAQPAEIVSLKALPADIRAVLGDISDRGGRFAPGCVSMHGEPHSRFRSARLGADTAQVTVERGGIAHFYDTLEFRKVDGRWVEQPKPMSPARG